MSKINIDVNDLTLEEKIGQMFIIGMEGTTINDRIITMIQKYKVGGIILYRKNFSDYDSLLSLINKLKKLNSNNKIPLFIAIDQEGGRVNRMPREFNNLKTATDLANLDDLNILARAGRVTGKMLRESGFNMNFSPVLDLKKFGDKHPIGDRSFGTDPDKVADCGIEVMKNLESEGVISVIKHFPGHGATSIDSHFTLPVINKNIVDLENEDTKVFEKAIKSGADAIMVGHLVIPKLTGLYPASLSYKFITEVLKKKYRYRGLIITDDLKMKAIRFIYGAKTAVKLSFKAGNDLVIMRFKSTEEKQAINNIYNLVKKNKLKIHRIDNSVKKIIHMKEKYNISDEPVIGCNIEEINAEIQSINEKILKKKKNIKK